MVSGQSTADPIALALAQLLEGRAKAKEVIAAKEAELAQARAQLAMFDRAIAALRGDAVQDETRAPEVSTHRQTVPLQAAFYGKSVGDAALTALIMKGRPTLVIAALSTPLESRASRVS